MSSPSPHGIALFLKVFIAPENVARFFEYAKPIFDAVTAEPECQFFEIYQSPDDPGAISWVEHWYSIPSQSQLVFYLNSGKDLLTLNRNATSEWLFDVQLKKDYYTEYFKATEPMYIKPREFQVVNRVGPPYSKWKGPVASDS